MFYDLNLAGDGIGDLARREVVAMAMQLGYTGVATSHTVMGVMADSDRCKIAPLELQRILAAAPGIAESARFHRELLGVPHREPFRQFTRLNVVVDNPAQANVLNSGNPVLKTYDLVAVKPTNQKMFNQCCTQLDVDMISLDVSQKLPYKLKMPVLKTAVERGIYFEISYGRSIYDLKARRELFTNAQMLQVAARGRNIILSSGACRTVELRGPNDVANLSTLFGLSLESAKNAVSRNCKAVLLRAITRKATYRNAIHISTSHPPADNAMDSNDLFSVPLDWDPLSLGGASADFIPTDIPSKSRDDLSSKAAEDTRSAGLPANEHLPLDASVPNASLRSDSPVELAQNAGENGTPDVEFTHDHNHLAQPASGLVTLRDTKDSASVKIEVFQHTPRTPVQSLQEGRGQTKARDNPSGEKARRKKSRKRKRKSQ